MVEQDKIFHTLVIEDNPGEYRLLQEAFKILKKATKLYIINSEIDAIDCLKESSSLNSVLPDLIILDLNLPLKNGWDVLKELKADIHIQSIPILIFSNSTREEDIIKCYNL